MLNDSDIYCNYSGVPGFGKSTLAVYDGWITNYYLHHDYHVAESLTMNQFISKNVVYKPTAKDINDLLRAKKYNVKVFDEGYLAALNLMPVDKFLVEFIQNVNITRSSCNSVGFCFQNMERAVRALKERFNLWVHKPFKARGYLFAKSNLFITKDPWGVKNLLDATTEEAILFHLNHNPNKVITFKTRPLKERAWKFYNELKVGAHEEIKKSRDIRESIAESHTILLDELYDKISSKNMALTDIPDYLREKYDFNESQIKGTSRSYLRYEEMKKIRNVYKKRNVEQIDQPLEE